MRDNALCAFLAGASSATMAWLGLYGFAWTDYENEARPSFEALVHGHPLEFLRLAPVYGGSLVERAPFALLPGLWGGGELAVYRMVAFPCLLAAAVLGVWLAARMRSEGHPAFSRAVTLGLCVANPLTLRALELGHPEELLGACLCVAAVLLASRERPLAAAVLLGLAIANKEWALLAAGPVLLALPAKRRLVCAATTGVVAAAILAPLALVSSGSFVAGARGIAAPPATIFQPWQVWWFLGHHGALVHGLFGAPKPGYRVGPSWAGEISHPLILVMGLVLTVALWLRRRHAGKGASLIERDALLALALLLLLRCLLDTWDTVYYLLPFVLALLAWEIHRFPERPPLLALVSTALAWITFQWLPAHASPDVQSAFFLAWTLPLAVALAVALYLPERALVDEGKLLRQARKPLMPVLADQR
ncbi:MAG TPA: glycosyltransferase 87 family protein [Solirubrobacteraceae bacterium]